MKTLEQRENRCGRVAKSPRRTLGTLFLDPCSAERGRGEDKKADGRGETMASLDRQEYRVIWVLNDRHLMYSCIRNSPGLWSLEEVDGLVENHRGGFGCYTPNLELYFPSVYAAHLMVKPIDRGGLIPVTGYLIQRASQKIVEEWLPGSLIEKLGKGKT